MTSNLFIVKVGLKRIEFIRTESGRFFDITGCQPISDNQYGLNLNGVLKSAKQVSPQYAADLVAKTQAEANQAKDQTMKGKASSKTKRQRKRTHAEEVHV